MNHVKLCRVVGLMGILAATAATGCKKPEKKDAVSPSGSASSAAAASGGSACEQLGKKICDKVGEKSGACTGAKNTLELLADSACTAGIKDFSFTEKKLQEQGKKCEELVEKLCTGVGKETETCKMVQEKTKSFPPDQCSQMLEHVDEIVTDLKQQEKANQPLTNDQMVAIAAEDAPSFGPKTSKVTIVEFSDFQCPFCAKAANVTSQIKEKYGDKVHFVFRQFPLSFHQNAAGAAQAALAANAQGKFWEFHDEMFKNQAGLARPDLEKLAKTLGLNVDKFKQDLDSAALKPRVDADVKMGEDVMVQGTPTMFINGKRISNPTDFDAVSKDIESALGS
ncbi:MAG TPA: thioredoxin domain-containing protein [Polyangiaceae bacterium]|jgi:protein-disulfide isomerase|nr:thioredoxin domain-containing protein [Polyangiaceae bacterium]